VRAMSMPVNPTTMNLGISEIHFELMLTPVLGVLLAKYFLKPWNSTHHEGIEVPLSEQRQFIRIYLSRQYSLASSLSKIAPKVGPNTPHHDAKPDQLAIHPCSTMHLIDGIVRHSQ
jgi:hypothetical protein